MSLGPRPPDQKQLTESAAELHIRKAAFAPGPPHRTGVGLEWLLVHRADPARQVPPQVLSGAADAVRRLPLHSLATVEAGGQLKLNARPAASLTRCLRAIDADLGLIRERLRDLGLEPVGLGLHPWLPPRRVVDSPRYAALEAHFDRFGPAGRFLMTRSAATRILVDSGERGPGPLGQGRRWRMAHLLGAVLAAAFANSPLRLGAPTGLRSTRLALWTSLEAGLAPARTDEAPAAAWSAHVLDAPVMFVRTHRAPWFTPRGLTFRDWVRGKVRGLRPTLDDLDGHIGTLFPPVRPRRGLELRMIDAQPGPTGWLVPLAVASTLFDDPVAAETAYRAVKPLADRAGVLRAPRNPLWRTAIRDGLRHPELREAAVLCFAAALEALPRRGVGETVQGAVAAFAERYVARGRCPADDVLDQWKESHA